MLLIWTVYRVWGMRSCGESEEDEERGLKWPPKELSSPLLQYQIHWLWEVPVPSPLLWPPDAPPKADWSLSDCAVGLGAFRGQVRVLMPGGGPFAQARTL